MVKIKQFASHVEVYDGFGRFLFSADTADEAYRLLSEQN